MFLAPKRKRRPRCRTGAAASPSLLLVLAAGAGVEGCSAVGAGAAGVAWAASPARAQGGEAGSVGGANERRRRRRGATGPSLRAIAQTQTGRACQPTETHCVPAGGPSERGALLQQGRGAAAPLAGRPTAPRGCAAACRSSGGGRAAGPQGVQQPSLQRAPAAAFVGKRRWWRVLGDGSDSILAGMGRRPRGERRRKRRCAVRPSIAHHLQCTGVGMLGMPCWLKRAPFLFAVNGSGVAPLWSPPMGRLQRSRSVVSCFVTCC